MFLQTLKFIINNYFYLGRKILVPDLSSDTVSIFYIIRVSERYAISFEFSLSF